MYDLQSGVSTQVGQHEGPIKCVRWFEMGQGGILATGSWDKTLRVREHPLFAPNSISFLLLLYLLTQHMVTDAGKRVRRIPISIGISDRPFHWPP